jgi:hypothetical protein
LLHPINAIHFHYCEYFFDLNLYLNI